MRYVTGVLVSIGVFSVVSCDLSGGRKLADSRGKEALSGETQGDIDPESPESPCPAGSVCDSRRPDSVSWDFVGGFEAPPWDGAELALQRLEPLRGEAFRNLYRPSDEQIYAAFSKLTRAPAATRFGNGVVAQWLQSSGYPDREWYRRTTDLVDEVSRRSNRDCTNYGFLMATSELGLHIYNSKRSLKEIVTADYMMVNPCTARSLGLDPESLGFDNPKDSQSFVPVTLPSKVNPGESYSHAGVLSDFAFLLRYPALGANMNRSRAVFVLRDLLGVDLSEAAANAPVVEGVFNNPVMDNPQCVSCHRVMDPVAQLFMGFDGRVNEAKLGFRDDMFAAGFLGKAYGSSQAEGGGEGPEGIHWLAREIASSEAFARHMMGYFWTELFGLSRARFVGTEDEALFEAFYADVFARFMSADLRLDALIDETLADPRLLSLRPSVTSSDSDVSALEENPSGQVFRPVSAGSLFGRMKRLLDDLGSTLDTEPGTSAPSEIFSKSLTQLKNDYDAGLGEPDLVNLERPQPEIDLIYSASFARVTSELSCMLAAHEVSRPQEARLIFRLSEEASPFSKKRNWSHWYEDLSGLHVRLTGEFPRPSEVLRYWKLYNELLVSDLESEPTISPVCQTFVTGPLKQPSAWLSPDKLKAVSRLSGLFFFLLTDPRVLQF